ncbi:AfsR/SARP family transcriptional regulator [Streptomyces viridochromogenes]|uniref:AfsR/SARP family transcriptional regulator n=1 Tax=Streptomyces viridochromogenes TaxID=1938 RepID=UPI0006C3DEB8|nr:BTAD domain-containing putative transcriptional regulator [Streptomyces viridochromogenes]KOG20716.1 SARP family transcriptional regulator [Streptomyces viridochromogenes]KOG21509.1 SARP family transcriptional regulator [Streptomyces viridochromogenes]
MGRTSRLRIEVLGPLQAWRGEARLDLGPVKRQAVLAALLLRQGAVVSHEQLLDGVWGDEPPASKVLPTHVNSLRRALDPEGTPHTESVIRSGKGWYHFVLDGVRLDTTDLAERGEVALRAKKSGQLALATEQFGEVLGLFRGEPLAGLEGPFARTERDRLTERRRALRRAWLECLVLLGRFREALDDLADVSGPDLYDESLLALRIRALYGCERQAEALNTYEDMRIRLRDELGVSPGEELRRVHKAVLKQDDGSLLGAAPARYRVGAVNELPGDLGQLTGREAELAQLTAPAAPGSGSVSIVTVDGPAGVGKSALVVRAARVLSADHPDGCLFMDLRAHSTHQRQSPARALQRLLRSLGAAKGELPSDLDELTAAWRAATSSLRLLLVLDDALDADQIRPLLPAGAGSRVLVAGRRRLAELDADVRVTLEPLASGDAVSLLTHLIGEERASREPEAARRLAGLCDGLPLALRIAGSRLQNRRVWTVEYLVGRLTDDEGRLGELRVGNRSVEAAFRLSYDQLTSEQQRAFRVLGLAPTVEFDVLTPAAMLGRPARDTERLLESLVDMSLLQEPRPGRYRLHDLVRVHARRLAEAEPEAAVAARRAALRLFLDAGRMASDWGSVAFPTGPQPTAGSFGGWREAETWLDAAGGELPDVVAYAVEFGEIDYACWIAHALCDYFVRQGRYHESQTALETALARVDEADDEHMTTGLRGCLAYTSVYQRRYQEARALFTEGLRLSRHHGHPIDEARALTGLGSVAVSVGEADQAISHVTEGVFLSRRLGDDWAAAMARLVQGRAHQIAGRDEEALACFAAACMHAEAGGRQHVLGRVLSLAADAHLRLGRHGEARHRLRQAVHLGEQCGDVFFCARNLTRLGTVEQGEGNPRAALAFHRLALELHESLSRVTEPAYDWLEMDIRTRLATAHLATGSVHEAHRQFQRVLDVYEARKRRKAHADRLAEDRVRRR